MAVYGIDFGTCNSCIAVAEDEANITVVPSSSSQNTTPSMVMFNIGRNGKPVVGETAKRAINIPNSNNVIAFIKTEMGDELTSREYKISLDEERKLSPIEPVACIYYELFEHANTFRSNIGLSTTNNAVITVPANCSEIQREQTKIAAQLAGINVLQIINEPTAAAISYNISVGETIMVFDLGGGTLDVSIITRLSEQNYKVLSTCGDPNLGGKDWDKNLMSLCYENVGLAFSDDIVTPKDLLLFEGYKIDICNAGNAYITFVDNEGLQQCTSVEIEEFQQNSVHLVGRAMKVVDDAIRSAHDSVDNLNISCVCLAGGASKMPMIEQSLQQHLPSIPVKICDPDLAIAKGAAKYALALSSENVNYDIIIDERGHSYGLVTYNHNSTIIVDNIILNSDPIEISGRTITRYMSRTGDKLKIKIIESNISDLQYPYREEPACFSDDIVFPEKLKIGTRVDLSLSRDADGIVYINTTYGSNKSSGNIKFATKISSVSEELKERVSTHLSKMNS